MAMILSSALTSEQKSHQLALKTIKRRKPGTGTVDSLAPQCMQMAHLRLRLKQKQLQEIRCIEIQRDNHRLLQKMAMIITSPVDTPARASRSGPMPLRRRQLERIEADNAIYSKRLAEIKPYYNRQAWSKERQEQEQILQRMNRWGHLLRPKTYDHALKSNEAEPTFKEQQHLRKAAIIKYSLRESKPMAMRRARRQSKATGQPPGEGDSTMHPSMSAESIFRKRSSRSSANDKHPNTGTAMRIRKARRRRSLDALRNFTPSSESRPSMRLFTPGRFPVKPPEAGVRANSPQDRKMMTELTAGETADVVVMNRRVELTTIARVASVSDVELCVEVRLDTKLVAGATLVARMPAIALVDPDATHNFIHAVASCVMHSVARELDEKARKDAADGITEDFFACVDNRMLQHMVGKNSPLIWNL